VAVTAIMRAPASAPAVVPEAGAVMPRRAPVSNSESGLAIVPVPVSRLPASGRRGARVPKAGDIFASFNQSRQL